MVTKIDYDPPDEMAAPGAGVLLGGKGAVAAGKGVGRDVFAFGSGGGGDPSLLARAPHHVHSPPSFGTMAASRFHAPAGGVSGFHGTTGTFSPVGGMCGVGASVGGGAPAGGAFAVPTATVSATATAATAGLFAKARHAQLEAARAEKEYLRAKKDAAEMAARIAQQEFLLARHQLQRIEAQKVAAFVAGDANAAGLQEPALPVGLPVAVPVLPRGAAGGAGTPPHSGSAGHGSKATSPVLSGAALGGVVASAKTGVGGSPLGAKDGIPGIPPFVTAGAPAFSSMLPPVAAFGVPSPTNAMATGGPFGGYVSPKGKGSAPDPDAVPSLTPPLAGEDHLRRSLGGAGSGGGAANNGAEPHDKNKKKRDFDAHSGANVVVPGALLVPKLTRPGAVVKDGAAAVTAATGGKGVVALKPTLLPGGGTAAGGKTPMGPPSKKSRKQLDADARDERLKDLFMPKYPLTAYNFFFSVEREKILTALSKAGTAGSKELDDAKDDDGARERAIANLLARSATDEEHESFKKSWTDRMVSDQKGRYDPDKKKKRLHRKTHGKIGFVHLARIISSRWRALPTGTVRFYRDLADADMARWKEATKVYRRNKALVEMGLPPEKKATLAPGGGGGGGGGGEGGAEQETKVAQ